MAPIDMKALRRTIEAAPDGPDGAVVSKRWLEQVERDLIAGNAARAKIKAHRQGRIEL